MRALLDKYLKKVSFWWYFKKSIFTFLKKSYILTILYFILSFFKGVSLMLRFRFHRSSLEESLSTTVSFNSFFDFFNYLIHNPDIEFLFLQNSNTDREHLSCASKVKMISIHYYSYDSRIGEHLFGVFVNGSIIGFCY